MKKTITITAFIVFLSVCAYPQELDCDVSIDPLSLTGLSGQARENLVDFSGQVKQYLTTYHWTKEDLGGEKIRCTIQFTFLGAQNDNHYSVKTFVGAQRPIYKSAQSTPLIRLLDDKWDFDYIRSQAFVHDDVRFDPLMSFLDFYANVIIGYDFDSGDFEFSKPSAGTPYFQRALEIIN